MPERKKRVYDFSLPAYSTSGKEGFTNKLVIRFDFRDYDKSIREMRRSIKEANDETRKLVAKLKKTNKGFGVHISAKQVADRAGFGNELISFELPGAQQFSSELAPFLTDIGDMGKKIMLKYATRVETKLMRKSIGYMQRRPGSGYAQVEVGWVRRWHRYFGFQEDGARNIPPMRSILRTSMEMQAQDEKVRRIYSKYFRKIFLEKGRNG